MRILEKNFRLFIENAIQNYKSLKRGAKNGESHSGKFGNRGRLSAII